MKAFLLILFTIITFTVVGQVNNQDGNIIEHNTQLFPRSFNPDWAPFVHGVASGDPLEDRVIIWTRITLDPLPTEDIEVNWKMSLDPELSNIIAEGTATTGADKDYTIKVDVLGLDSGTTYYYGFEYNGISSLTGRTKTTPSDNVDHLKFAVVSCSNYQAGYFNAYRNIADRNDIDAVIHLGDYIYEYGNFVYGSDSIWENRLVEPATEIISLNDYRNRYSTYRLDTSLIRVHQQHPMISVWDDHETTNDSYVDGAENHDDSEGDWEERKAIGKQVYFEWMPIRDNDDEIVYRKIQYGNLMDLIMLDTRLEGREEQINDVTNPLLYAEDRTLLGEEQKSWFKEQLDISSAKWKIVGQQVIFAHFNVGWAAILDPSLSYQQYESTFMDIWDGYPAERSELINYIDTNNIDNIVFLTGDFHSSFAFDITDTPIDLQFVEVTGVGTLPFFNPSPEYNGETGEGSVAVEFATPSICSANFDENIGAAVTNIFQATINNNIQASPTLSLGNPNPHLKFNDLSQHGYFILDVKQDSVQANFYYNPILEISNQESFGAAYYTLDGENKLQQSATESAEKTIQDIPAPLNPPATSSTLEITDKNITALSLFPNPVSDNLNITVGINKASEVNISILNMNGELVKTLGRHMIDHSGIFTLPINIQELSDGQYLIQLDSRVGKATALFQVLR